ncbi:MAG TPA: glycosyltransferase [Sphingomonas sp.]|nr:glycosyltransferase [Sphingomonas sp.]
MNKPLSIMAFIHSFEPGGVERAALRLAAGWRMRGADVRLVVGRTSGALRDEADALPYCAPRDGGRWTARFETLWMIGRLRRQVLAHRPDILFCAGNTYTVVAVAMKLLLGRNCPPIVAKISNDLVRHDLPGPARALYRLWLRLQGRLMDHFVGMAEPMRAEIIEAMRVPPHCVSIIDNPALSKAEIEALSADRTTVRPGRRFIAVGRLVRQKNYPLLLSAFASGAEPDDRLTILGEGPERARLAAQADRLGLGGRFAMPGHVPDAARWLAASDVLLLSSHYEGLPAVIVEALAAGLGIVATDCGAAMGWLLEHGRLGRLVPPGDEAAFAEAIATAAPRSPDPLEARARARRFTAERAADAYLALMRSLVAPGAEAAFPEQEEPSAA